MTDDTRFENIEFKLAHLEQALAELNDVVTRQQRELDSARERLQRLADRTAAAAESQAGSDPQSFDPSFEKPPHY